MRKRAGKPTKTIRYRVLHEDVTGLFQETAALYRRCVEFYVAVLKENIPLLEIKKTNELQGRLEAITHQTKSHPTPIYDLATVGENIPGYFRRSAINRAIGIAQSWQANYQRWLDSGKKHRPPVLRLANRQWPLYYKGLYKDFTARTVMVKLRAATTWVWRKLRISTTHPLADQGTAKSIQLLLRSGRPYVHRAMETKRKQRTEDHQSVVAVDLNLERTVVMAVVGADGRVQGTRSLNTRQENRCRKLRLDAVARKQKQTKTIPEGESFCRELWAKVRHQDENLAHQLSRQIVDFTLEHGCKTIVFEHLGSLQPDRKTQSRKMNSRRMYWLKGAIFEKTRYKADFEGL